MLLCVVCVCRFSLFILLIKCLVGLLVVVCLLCAWLLLAVYILFDVIELLVIVLCLFVICLCVIVTLGYCLFVVLFVYYYFNSVGCVMMSIDRLFCYIIVFVLLSVLFCICF